MFRNDETRALFIGEVESGEFVDTSVVQAATLENSGTQFQGKWVVNYVAAEVEEKGLRADGTLVAISLSWGDFKHVGLMGTVDHYEWCSDSGKAHLSIFRLNIGSYRRLECGCDATVMVQDEVGVYFCCDEVASENADFSQFLGRILNKRDTVSFSTLDGHLKLAVRQVKLE